jgi:hypothetical protein
LLDPRAVVLGDEEVRDPGQLVAIQAAIGNSRYIDVTICIGGNIAAVRTNGVRLD